MHFLPEATKNRCLEMLLVSVSLDERRVFLDIILRCLEARNRERIPEDGSWLPANPVGRVCDLGVTNEQQPRCLDCIPLAVFPLPPASLSLREMFPTIVEVRELSSVGFLCRKI